MLLSGCCFLMSAWQVSSSLSCFLHLSRTPNTIHQDLTRILHSFKLFHIVSHEGARAAPENRLTCSEWWWMMVDDSGKNSLCKERDGLRLCEEIHSATWINLGSIWICRKAGVEMEACFQSSLSQITVALMFGMTKRGAAPGKFPSPDLPYWEPH